MDICQDPLKMEFFMDFRSVRIRVEKPKFPSLTWDPLGWCIFPLNRVPCWSERSGDTRWYVVFPGNPGLWNSNIAPKNGRLEFFDPFPLGQFRPIFRGVLLLGLGRVVHSEWNRFCCKLTWQMKIHCFYWYLHVIHCIYQASKHVPWLQLC